MPKKKLTEEEKQRKLFQKTQAGIFISSIEEFLYVLAEVAKNERDEQFQKKRESYRAAFKKFVDAYNSEKYFEKYDVYDESIIIAILRDMEKTDRETLLCALATHIELLDKELENSKGKTAQEIERHLEKIEELYNCVSPFFYEVKMEEKYKKLLKASFRELIDLSEKLSANPRDEEELEFAHELKNYVLIFRGKMKQVRTDSDDIAFIDEFFESLTKAEKDFFKSECLQFLIDMYGGEFKGYEENHQEYYALAMQVMKHLEETDEE